MTAEVTQYIQLGVSVVIGIFVAYQTYIQKTQVKSQKEIIDSQTTIISNMKAVTEIVSIPKIKEYTNWIVETAEYKASHEVQKKEEEFNNQIKEFTAKMELSKKSFEELNKFIFDELIKHYSPDEARELIISKLTINAADYVTFFTRYEVEYLKGLSSWIEFEGMRYKLDPKFKGTVLHSLMKKSNELKVFEYIVANQNRPSDDGTPPKAD